jgi:hypothetical protein
MARFPIRNVLRHDLRAILDTFGLVLLMALGFYLPLV